MEKSYSSLENNVKKNDDKENFSSEKIQENKSFIPKSNISITDTNYFHADDDIISPTSPIFNKNNLDKNYYIYDKNNEQNDFLFPGLKPHYFFYFFFLFLMIFVLIMFSHMNVKQQKMIGSTNTEKAKFSEYIEEWYSSIRSSPPSQAPTGFDIHYAPLYPAEYIITQNNTWGNSNISRLSPVVVYFNSGDLVNITQIQFSKEDDRIRGKLSESHNWITLRRLKTNHMWAEPNDIQKYKKIIEIEENKRRVKSLARKKKAKKRFDNTICENGNPRIHYIENSPEILLLASFPGSGNTWTRHLIEQMTNVFSGAAFTDRRLKPCLCGEGIWNSSVSVVKTHFPFVGGTGRINFPETTGVIIVQRNPFYAFKSEINRIGSHGHSGLVIEYDPDSEKAKQLFEKNLIKYIEFHKFYEKFKGNKLLIFYENLLTDTLKICEAMGNFIVKYKSNMKFIKHWKTAIIENKDGCHKRKVNNEINKRLLSSKQIVYFSNKQIEKLCQKMNENNLWNQNLWGDCLTQNL